LGLPCKWEGQDEPSRVTFDIERNEEIVRLTVTQENLADEREYEDVADPKLSYPAGRMDA
jgi:hypothetical protein